MGNLSNVFNRFYSGRKLEMISRNIVKVRQLKDLICYLIFKQLNLVLVFSMHLPHITIDIK